MRATNPWQTFCWFTALMAAMTLIVVQQGAVSWFLEHFSSTATLHVSAAMIILFVLVFFIAGGSAGRTLQREYQTLLDIADKFSAPGAKRFDLADKLLVEGYNGPTIMRHVLRVYSRFRSYKSKHPVDKDLLVEIYEGKLFSSIRVAEHCRQLLFYLGLLGTVGGIIYALAISTIPRTAEEVQKFSFVTLEGLGVSYTSTFFGMGGAIVLFLLIGRYERWADEILGLFRVQFEEVLLALESGPDSDGDEAGRNGEAA